MINGKKQTIREYVDDNIGSVEGTAVKSTGETGATKFLREDGDGTCSWQTPSGSSATVATGSEVDTGTDNTKMVTPKAMEDSSYTKLALGETSATAYRGDRGKTAYDHSQAKGAGTDIDTASDDTKWITSKAIADSTTVLTPNRISSLGTLDSFNESDHIFIVLNINDGVLYQGGLSQLRSYFDTIYTQL